MVPDNMVFERGMDLQTIPFLFISFHWPLGLRVHRGLEGEDGPFLTCTVSELLNVHVRSCVCVCV